MSNPQTNIIRWFHAQQDWLQETVSRILNNDQITDTDIEEITTLLKSDIGKGVTNTRTFPGLSSSTTVNTLFLGSIGEVKGIDTLAPRNSLNFGASNLTVIYGNNGSGKSGYTRILKKATGKAGVADLKHNVFATLPTDRSCKITYNLNGTTTEITWTANSEAIKDLKGVDIFDADNAKMYLTREKEASYTPPLIALFESMVATVKKINLKLESEKNLLVRSLPSLPAQYTDTNAGRLYNNLRAYHTDEPLLQITSFSETDQKAIDELKIRLIADDPSAIARQKRSEKAQIDVIISQLIFAYNKVSDEACNELILQKKDAVTKRQIATETVDSNRNLFNLEGVGSDTWRALWKAARDYSISEAYKNDNFPKVDNAKCVLCHQDINEDAQKRLLTFETFINSTLEKDASAAENTLGEAINKLPASPTPDRLNESLQFTGLNIEEWYIKLNSLWEGIACRTSELAHVTEYTEPKEFEISPILSELKSISETLEVTTQRLDDDAKLFDRTKANMDLMELETKVWTSAQVKEILNEVQRLKIISTLDTYINLTKTRLISIKASELSESIITEEYLRRFNIELSLLGANRIKVELVKTRVQEGIVKHQIKLKDVLTNMPLVDVLSEGEQRIISLAAFLADVTGKSESTPFVFDDPISSLDQDFEERTIDRLIQLSEDRQVLVFTHRLSFLGIIIDKTSSLQQIHIRKEPWGTGEVGEIPLFGKKPENALTNLKNDRLVKAKKILVDHGTDAYNPLAKAICSDYRILLERVVELYFLADIVQRHRRSINTLGKIESLVKITQSDCDLINTYMTKYSFYEHSQSSESPVELPLPDELEHDINTILTWYDEFRGR